MANDFTVYVHISPSGKRYVGITHYPVQVRWNDGKAYSRHNKHFWAAIQKYGWDNFEHHILATNLSKEWACQLEKIFIRAYNSTDPSFGYNVMPGGDCTAAGRVVSDATREKLRQIATGRKMSPEAVEKMRNSKRGHLYGPRPDYVKEKISKAQIGKFVSEETREKQRLAKLGTKRSPEARAKASASMKRVWEERRKINNATVVQTGKAESAQ